MSSLRNYTTVLLIRHDLLLLLFLIWTSHRFFLLPVLGWHMRFYSNFITSHTKRFWQDLKYWSFAWVSFIVVIVIAIVVDSFLYIYKSIFRSSMKCCWYVWVVLLIETCIFGTNYGTVSLTLDVIFLYWDFVLSLKCAHSGPNPDRFWLPVNISSNIVNKQTQKM